MKGAGHGIPWGSQLLVTRRFASDNFIQEIAGHVLENVTIRNDSRPSMGRFPAPLGCLL